MKHFIIVIAIYYCLWNEIADANIDRPRGVAISKNAFYISGKDFTCLDGSITIPFNHINDDYCDCLDASDEPGTSACPNGSFHCTNAGHKPMNIPSSRVNDGICDCCDGTDEYDGHSQCENACKELGRAAREDAERVKKLTQEGYEIYKEYCQLGTEARKEKQAQLAELQRRKAETEAKKNEMQQLKEEAEIPEKEAKDAHQNLVDSEKTRLEALKTERESDEAFEELDTNHDGMVSVNEIQVHTEFDIDSNGDVSNEEAREYLEDKDAVDVATFKELIWPNVKSIYKKVDGAIPVVDEGNQQIDVDESAPEDDHHDDYDESDYDYDRDDEDEHYYDEDDDSSSHEEDDGKEDETTDGSEPDYDEQTKLFIAMADKSRAEFNEAETQFKNAENELKEVENFLGMDLGPDDVFFPLKGSCYEFTDREYTYKFCPFDKASQRSKNGGSETSLGKYGRWDGPESNKYSVMLMENGQNCWNGPNRSVKVHIKCGLNNELIGASEPNKCEYEYQFLSPVACTEDKQNAMNDHEHIEL